MKAIQQELTELMYSMDEWKRIKASEFIPSYYRNIHENKIYNWMVDNKKLNLYKYCLFIIRAVNERKYETFMRILEEIKLCYIGYGAVYKYKIGKDMLNYFKDKFRDVTFTGYYTIQEDYYNSLFVNSSKSPRDHYKNLTLEQAKFLLKSCHMYRYNGFAHIGDCKHVRFILECKKLGISDNKIKKNIRFNSGDYERITWDYYKHLKTGSRIEYEKYLFRKKFEKDSIACMEFIRALSNTVENLEMSDITISGSNIKEIMDRANILAHLE